MRFVRYSAHAPSSIGIEVLAGVAMDEDEKSDTCLRALKQIADETAADVEGMIVALTEQIALLGEIVVALHLQK